MARKEKTNLLGIMAQQQPIYEQYATIFKKKKGRPHKTIKFETELGMSVKLTKNDLKKIKNL